MKHQRIGKRDARCFASLIGIIVTVSLVSFAVASGNDSVYLAANAATTQNGWSLEGSFITYESLCDLRASNLSPQIVRLAADTELVLTTLCENLEVELQEPLAFIVKVRNPTSALRTLKMPFPSDVILRDGTLAKSALAIYYPWVFKGEYYFTAISSCSFTIAADGSWIYEGKYKITTTESISISKKTSAPFTILLEGRGENEADVKPNSAVEFLYLIPRFSGKATIEFGDIGSFTATSLIDISGVNDPPLVSDIPDQTIDEGGTLTGISLGDYVSDPDNEEGEIAWTYSGNDQFDVIISDDRTASFTFKEPDWIGSETITFTETEPYGLSDSDSATFTVIPVNDPPVVSDIPDQTIEVGGTFTSIFLDDYVSDPDNEDAEMAWTYSGNAELSVDISNDRIATITMLGPEWSGSETITFTVTDPGGLSDSDSATFTVEAAVVLGDVDNNGNVRSNDAILALRIAAGLMEPDEYQKQAADMNGDSEVRANDAILILRKAAGLVAPSEELPESL